MSLFNVFEISGTALSAQGVRLNAIASNLANAGVVSSTPEAAYRARQPVFATIYDSARGSQQPGGVKIEGVYESKVEPRKEFSPAHPMADDDGYIYLSNVNSVEEMANMISASRSYQSSVEAMNTTKQLIIRTLSLGR
ncbi:MAG: flagellar basal body rod protein FlgC [Gammaproteobacteria bacterium]|jgi:flagellar basal-body rod protein FlgC|nr:flagellar basal body rod protein FlgC [Gammaproteobacteria bacterium]